MTGSAALDWQSGAACAGWPWLPWMRDETDVSPWDALTMHVVCDSCPVREQCEEAVADWGITGGWWAGKDRDPQAMTPLLIPDWMLPTPDDIPVAAWAFEDDAA